MLIADPVMNAEIAAKEMKSTIHPRRASPRKQMMAPEITLSADAMTWPGISGLVALAASTTLPVITDATATGYQ
ncbi:MAG: hypothetical protein Q9187_007136, partial [Circinaria calcarea]